MNFHLLESLFSIESKNLTREIADSINVSYNIKKGNVRFSQKRRIIMLSAVYQLSLLTPEITCVTKKDCMASECIPSECIPAQCIPAECIPAQCIPAECIPGG